MDALYFTVVTFATVSFGDITPVAELARITVTIQIVVDLILVGLVVRVFIQSVQRGLARRDETIRPTSRRFRRLQCSMTRLRTVSPDSRGWSRRRAKKGFVYLDEGVRGCPPRRGASGRWPSHPPGASVDLPIANGHLQAVGTDDAGRRQYLYHPAWREQRDQAEFARVTAAAQSCPGRAPRATDLAATGMPLDRAAATAVRLLDLGYFRIGADAYAEDNGSFGLTTLERHHVRRRGAVLVFHFVGKSGIEYTVEIDDPAIEA